MKSTFPDAAELQAYAPEKVAKATGVHPSVVEQLAKELSGSRVAIVNLGFAVGKHFNGMLSQRAVASLTAFLGKMGPFGGLATENEWSISGLEGLSGFQGRYTHRFASGFVSEFMLGGGMDGAERGFDEQGVRRATGTSRGEYRRQVEALLDQSAGDEGEKRGKPWWKETETFLVFADSRFRRNKGAYLSAIKLA